MRIDCGYNSLIFFARQHSWAQIVLKAFFYLPSERFGVRFVELACHCWLPIPHPPPPLAPPASSRSLLQYISSAGLLIGCPNVGALTSLPARRQPQGPSSPCCLQV